MRQVTSPADIPNEAHFALLVYRTEALYSPGDERSKTHPGHGYPAHTVTTTTYEHWVTCDESELHHKVTELLAVPKYGRPKPTFAVLRVEQKLPVTMTVKIG
jgi:hypothetical protein